MWRFDLETKASGAHGGCMLSATEPASLVSDITFPDLHHVNAAIGWLDLGCPGDAALELDRATFKTLAHPEVVLLRWKICARSNNWQLALYLGRTLIRISPEKPASWLCLAFSLVNVQGAFDAWQELLEAARKYPRVSTVPVFLSRLCAQMTAEGGSTNWFNRWEQLEREAARLKQTGATVPAEQPKVLAAASTGGTALKLAAKPRISF